MWLSIIMFCSSVQAESCMVVTRKDLLPTQEECFHVSVSKAQIISDDEDIYYVQPMCQNIYVGKKIMVGGRYNIWNFR